MILNRNMISEIASNLDVFTRGEQLFYARKIISIHKTRENGCLVVDAQIESNHRLYATNVVFKENGELVNYKCSCEGYSIWRGACKHVVAVLFGLAENTITPVRKADPHTKVINELVSVLSSNSMPDISKPSDLKLSLDCCLNINVSLGETKLSFTLGQQRKYVVKSIADLYSCLINKTEMTFGKKLSFIPDYSLFDADSVKLLRFLVREFEVFSEISAKLYGSYNLNYLFHRSNDRFLMLHRRSFDDFFEIFNGKYVDAEINNTSKKYMLTDRKPDYKFNIEQIIDERTKNKEFRLSGPSVAISVLRGEASFYLLIDDMIHKVSQEYYKMLASLIKAMSVTSKGILFTGNNVEKFVSVIYPSMKKNELVGIEQGDFSELQNYGFTAKLYLHSDTEGIQCKVIFDYNGNEINPLTKSPYIYRDLPEEMLVINELINKGFTPDEQKGLYVLQGDDNIYDFLKNGVNELNTETREIYIADTLKYKIIKPVSKPGFRISMSDNLLGLTSDMSEYSVKELVEALESYELQMRYHKLKNGKYISFDDENIVNASEFLTSLDLGKKNIKNDKIFIPKYKALYLEAVSKKYDIASNASAEYQTMTQNFNSPENLDFDIPQHLNDILREYQKTGFKWLKMLAFYGFGGILADDMGLGKTVQVIALLSSDSASNKPSIVICPTSVLYNWENEIKRFSPGLKTLMVAGNPDLRKKLIGTDNIDVVLTTYDLLKRDIDEYSDIQFEYIIADEAQNIKNPTTQNAKSLKSLNGRVRFALTGTPIENNLTELWSIFDFILPDYLNNHTQFSKKYETPIIRDNDADKSERLKMQISPFIMRRLKRDVLTELPEKTETTLYAEMYPEQKKLYAANLRKARGDLDNIISTGNFTKNSLQILASLTRLRQICCHPSLFIDNYEHGSGKLDLTIETVNIALESGHRILLFSQFTSMLDILKTEFEAYKISYFYLDGSTNSELRARMVDKFNKGERTVFLISLKAGGVGLNLTGADVVIHYDQWWNPAVMDQASDRAHRFGQERAVQIFNIVAKDSIEERILELQSKKKDLIDRIIVDGGSFINKMTEQEVLSLFDN